MRWRWKSVVALIVFGVVVSLFTMQSPQNDSSILMKMGTTNLKELVQPDVNTLIIKPLQTFELQENFQRLFAVVMVMSTASAFDRRRGVRITWGEWAKPLNIRVFFLLAFHDYNNETLLQDLRAEQDVHDDLIIDAYEEGYLKLTGKVLRGLKWYTRTYSPETMPYFFVKTDHDVFLHLPNLVAHLKQTNFYLSASGAAMIPEVNSSNNQTYFFGGHLRKNESVVTDTTDKWYIPEADSKAMGWPRVYPVYSVGWCYVMSGNVVEKVFKESFHLQSYPFEDVFISGLVANTRLGLQISEIDEMWPTRNRDHLETIVAMHRCSNTEEMVNTCRNISSCGGVDMKSFYLERVGSNAHANSTLY